MKISTQMSLFSQSTVLVWLLTRLNHMTARLLLMLAVSAFVTVAYSGDAPSATPDGRPNILWIYVDDMSDWMGCYGDSIAKTPNIDSLADGGVTFLRAYMPAPVCSTTLSALIILAE